MAATSSDVMCIAGGEIIDLYFAKRGTFHPKQLFMKWILKKFLLCSIGTMLA